MNTNISFFRAIQSKRIIASLLTSFLVSTTAHTTAAPPAPYGPVPTANQTKWHQMEYYGLICYGLNTYTGQEWGYGDVSPKLFNPSDLDTDQWARVARDAGMKGLILVAKHHDGFCLWPSKTTDYTVASSPWKDGKGDVLADLSASCKKYGLKLGVYISPWDRNHSEYGKPAYIKDYHEQWREVLTHYGEIFEVWFDGANGGTGYYGGAREKRSIPKDYYQYEKVYQLIKKHQPQTIFFGHEFTEDACRWVGNEKGVAGTTNWCRYTDIKQYNPKKYGIGEKDGQHWIPAEADTTILHPKKWYYNPKSSPRTLSNFVDLYYTTVGRNASFNLGLSIGPDGRIPERDARAMLAQKKQLDRELTTNLAKQAIITTSNIREKHPDYAPGNLLSPDLKSYWASDDGVSTAHVTLEFKQPTRFNRLVLQEHIPLGQRVHRFTLETWQKQGWVQTTEGTTIGYKRILRFPAVQSSKVRVQFETDAPCLAISHIGLYNAPAIMTEPKLASNRDGKVTIIGPKGAEIHYALNQGAFQLYQKPFTLPLGGRVRSYAYDPASKLKTDIVQQTFGLPKTNWKVISSSFANEGAAGINRVIDGDSKSMWHTHGKGGRVPPPHWFIIDLGKTHSLSGFLAMPRHDGSSIGLVDRYSLHVSDDGKDWKLASSGEFSNIKNNPIEQEVSFQKPQRARYVKWVAERAVDGNSCAALCEFGLLAKPSDSISD
ncbi:alpha-L-fucosidase [Verrucomicrobiaceae bacterium N1E253]|uniref:alpha-L-fucosidase n=1 Tax=Oceaniferula marina TaxID=2748318 RepID=A0A851GCY1_9BACT|nr:alpha-L-fucosidase [Oceaniferula marina]NWK55039.1 alpha-L-fucosidase [Oceaniferula marina]